MTTFNNAKRVKADLDEHEVKLRKACLGKNKGKRVRSDIFGSGVITKVINGCLWVRMDDGTECSGHAQYWTLTRNTP